VVKKGADFEDRESRFGKALPETHVE